MSCLRPMFEEGQLCRLGSYLMEGLVLFYVYIPTKLLDSCSLLFIYSIGGWLKMEGPEEL